MQSAGTEKRATIQDRLQKAIMVLNQGLIVAAALCGDIEPSEKGTTISTTGTIGDVEILCEKVLVKTSLVTSQLKRIAQRLSSSTPAGLTHAKADRLSCDHSGQWFEDADGTLRCADCKKPLAD